MHIFIITKAASALLNGSCTAAASRWPDEKFQKSLAKKAHRRKSLSLQFAQSRTFQACTKYNNDFSNRYNGLKRCFFLFPFRCSWSERPFCPCHSKFARVNFNKVFYRPQVILQRVGFTMFIYYKKIPRKEKQLVKSPRNSVIILQKQPTFW